MIQGREPLIRTAAGSKSGSFGPSEWSMLGFLAVVWGSSFLLIAIGLDAFTPGMVAWLRLIVAVLVLSALPAVRHSVDRSDWPAVAVVCIAGNAGPALLFAYAEQTIETTDGPSCRNVSEIFSGKYTSNSPCTLVHESELSAQPKSLETFKFKELPLEGLA